MPDKCFNHVHFGRTFTFHIGYATYIGLISNTMDMIPTNIKEKVKHFFITYMPSASRNKSKEKYTNSLYGHFLCLILDLIYS